MRADLLEELRDTLLPDLRAFSQIAASELPGVRVAVEESRSDRYPFSAFVTFLAEDKESEVAVEIATHEVARGSVLTAEVLDDQGRIVTPALVSQLPSEKLSKEGRRSIQ